MDLRGRGPNGWRFASDSLMMEVDEARSMRRPVVTVSAASAELPPPLRERQGFRVKDLAEGPSAGRQAGSIAPSRLTPLGQVRTPQEGDVLVSEQRYVRFGAVQAF